MPGMSMLFTRDFHLHAYILPRFIGSNGPAIFWYEIERGDDVAFSHLFVHDKWPKICPAPRLLAGMFIELSLDTNKSIRDHTIRFRPGPENLLRGRIPKHILDRCQQRLADDRIMLCTDAKTAVLVADLPHDRENVLQVLDMQCCGIYRVCKCRLLPPLLLIRVIEYIEQFRIILRTAFDKSVS